MRTRDDELFTVLFFGLAVLFAGLGEILGVTDAIGAFLIGLIIGATRYRNRVEQFALPMRDVFGAFFFLNFGLGLNPSLFPSVLGPVAIAVGITIALNVIAGQFVAWLNKLGPQAGINTAVILQNRGEFALILATLSAGAGLDERLQPFAGLYVLIMAVLGPVLASNSERIGGVVLRTRRRAEREASEARRLERDARHSEEIALMEAALAGDEPGASRQGDGSGRSAEADADDEEALLGTRERAAAEAATEADADADAADYDDLDEQDRARAAILADQAGQQSDQRATRQRDPEY
jgi:CPA2 family monovalent cation:H+ antiporter-2